MLNPGLCRDGPPLAAALLRAGVKRKLPLHMNMTGDNKHRGEWPQSLAVPPLDCWLCTQKKLCLRGRESVVGVRRQLRNRVCSSSAQRRIWVDAAGSTAIPEPVKREEDYSDAVIHTLTIPSVKLSALFNHTTRWCSNSCMNDTEFSLSKNWKLLLFFSMELARSNVRSSELRPVHTKNENYKDNYIKLTILTATPVDEILCL